MVPAYGMGHFRAEGRTFIHGLPPILWFEVIRPEINLSREVKGVPPVRVVFFSSPKPSGRGLFLCLAEQGLDRQPTAILGSFGQAFCGIGPSLPGVCRHMRI
jgi:hypothetical protein